jgi:tetratricopeptide (TPR) repeat protein
MPADRDEIQKKRWQEINRAQNLAATQIELLKRFVRDYPRHGGGWHSLGRRLTDVSRFTEAEHALRKALRLCPREKRLFVYRSIGTLFGHRGDDAAAERWFRKAIAHSSDDAQGYIYLGGMLARLGRLDEAEAVHRKGTHCKAGCIDEAFLNLGYVLRAKERYSEAFGCFDRALAIDPKYKSARVARRDVGRVLKLRRGGRRKG